MLPNGAPPIRWPARREIPPADSVSAAPHPEAGQTDGAHPAGIGGDSLRRAAESAAAVAGRPDSLAAETLPDSLRSAPDSLRTPAVNPLDTLTGDARKAYLKEQARQAKAREKAAKAEARKKKLEEIAAARGEGDGQTAGAEGARGEAPRGPAAQRPNRN